MKTRIYKKLFNSAQKLKKGLGIDNFEAFKKKKKRMFFRFFYRKKFCANDLIAVMKTMGMQKDSMLFVHRSMKEIYNYKGTANEIIDKMIKIFGEGGTLIMSVYPDNLESYNAEVDMLKSPTRAGYVTEILKKHQYGKRCVNLQYSVCTFGKLADKLVSEHHSSLTSWDEFARCYKMSKMHTLAIHFQLYFLGTVIHYADSILRTQYRHFQLFFRKKSELKYSY